MPTSVAALDIIATAPAPRAGGIGTMNETSFFHRLARMAIRPQVCSREDCTRRDLNGMANSTVHPCSNRPVLESQMGFGSFETVLSLDD